MKFEDIRDPEDLYNYMQENIKYGFVSKKEYNIYSRKKLNNDKLYEDMLFNHYYLQMPNELMINKYGICYDQVEFARRWFEQNGYEVTTYFCNYHNHSILIYKDKSYNWFERTIPGYNGIHKFDNIDNLLEFYKNVQIKNAKNSISEIQIYKFYKVIFGCGFSDYINNITTNNQKILLRK